MDKKVTKVDFKEKKYFIELDGEQYEIPQRTKILEEKIKEHDEKLHEMTEYEANMLLIEIMFGKENAKKMFPDGENTNLDKLAKCVKYAIALYATEITEIKSEDTKKQIEELKPLLKPISDISNIMSNAKTKDFVGKKKK